jgi:hypothetical protein
MRIAVHMLSHRKKLTHFFFVIPNIGERLGYKKDALDRELEIFCKRKCER